MKYIAQHFISLALGRLFGKYWYYQWLALAGFFDNTIDLIGKALLTPAQFLENAYGTSQPKIEIFWITKDVAVKTDKDSRSCA